MTKDLIIDGNNLLFRASFVPIPPVIFNGQNVAAAQHFVRMIVKMAREYRADRVYVAWDKKHNPDPDKVFFRKQLIDDQYKSNRDSAKSAHIFDNVDAIDEVCRAMGIRTIHPFNLEADDAIAWLAQNYCESCVIVTSDSDLWQLITPTISIHCANKKKLLTPHNFHEVCDVDLCQYTLYKSILGDTSDNIPGIPGFGPKRTLKLVEAMDLDSLTPEQRKIVDRNMQIIDLKYARNYSPQDFEYFEQQASKFGSITFARDKVVAACNTHGLFELALPRNLAMLTDVFGKQDNLNALMEMFA